MTKVIDLSGQKFGKLTAIERVQISGVWKWKCQCDCGNETYVNTGCLRNGSTKSCGCGQIKDLSSQTFGRLTAIKIVGQSKSGSRQWLCKCECGNDAVVDQYRLSSGRTKSCGCINKEMYYVHGLARSRIYKIFTGMKMRCYNKNEPEYDNYGGRGIKVCDEWLDKEKGFANFYDWSMNNGYSDQLTIDRIDNEGNYEPSNCRWTDRKTQQNNTRWNVRIEYNGEIRTLSEWSELTGINKKTIWNRIYRYGWSVERALTEKVHTEFSTRRKRVVE